jgi:hypothetical protein
MIISFFRPARPVKAIAFSLLLAVPLIALSAQSGYGSKPQGTMSGPAAMQSAAPAGQIALEGVIVSIEGSTLVLAESKGGASRVLVQADSLILGRKASTFDSIVSGEAMGVTATRGPDGSLAATAINVFTPQLWQRVRKGQWDMGTPDQVMTNAQVDKLVDKVEGRTLYLKYEMLSAAISVPVDAVIRRSVELKFADLKPGMKVSVRLAPSTNGSLRAAMVSFDAPAG